MTLLYLDRKPWKRQDFVRPTIKRGMRKIRSNFKKRSMRLKDLNERKKCSKNDVIGFSKRKKSSQVSKRIPSQLISKASKFPRAIIENWGKWGKTIGKSNSVRARFVRFYI